MNIETFKKKYAQNIQKESQFWNRPNAHILTMDESDYLPAEIIEYMNESFTGSKELPWWKFLKTFGTYKKGVSLGCGIGFFEKKMMDAGICQEMDLIDLSENSLERAKKNLRAHKCNYYLKDINVIELPANHYDFILGCSSFHHFLNLERIVDEVKKSLKPGGIFVLYDYIGEKRVQWSQKKIDFINHIMGAIPLRHRINVHILSNKSIPPWKRLKQFLQHPLKKVERPKTKVMSPFEAIRPDEILVILEKRLETIYLEKLAWLFFPMITSGIKFKEIKDSSLLHFICDIDKMATQSSLFEDTIAFGIYKK